MGSSKSRAQQPGLGYYDSPYVNNYPYEGIENYGSYYEPESDLYGGEYYSTTSQYMASQPRRLYPSQPGINRYGMLYPGSYNPMFQSILGRPKIRVLFVLPDVYNQLLSMHQRNQTPGFNSYPMNQYPMNSTGNGFGNLGFPPMNPQYPLTPSQFQPGQSGFFPYPMPCAPPMIQPVIIPPQMPNQPIIPSNSLPNYPSWSSSNPQCAVNPGSAQYPQGMGQYPNIQINGGYPSMGPMIPNSAPMASCFPQVAQNFNPLQHSMHQQPSFYQPGQLGQFNALPQYNAGVFGGPYGMSNFQPPNPSIQPGLAMYGLTPTAQCGMQSFMGQNPYGQTGFGQNSMFPWHSMQQQFPGHSYPNQYGPQCYPGMYSGALNQGLSSSSAFPMNPQFGLSMYGTPSYLNNGYQQYPGFPYMNCGQGYGQNPFSGQFNQIGQYPPSFFPSGLHAYGQPYQGYYTGSSNYPNWIQPSTGINGQGNPFFPNNRQPGFITCMPVGNGNATGQPAVNTGSQSAPVSPQPQPQPQPQPRPNPNVAFPTGNIIYPGTGVNIPNNHIQVPNNMLPNCPGRMTLICCAVPQ